MEQLLTIKDAAKVLKVTTTTIYNLHRRGELLFTKIGTNTRITEGELKRFIKENTIDNSQMDNNAFIVPSGFSELIRDYDNATIGKAWFALMDYAEKGTEPNDLDAATLMLFTKMKEKIKAVCIKEG